MPATNAYIYAGNIPTQFNDPTGRFISSDEVAGANAVASAIERIGVSGVALWVLNSEFGSTLKNQSGLDVAYHYTHSETAPLIMAATHGGIRPSDDGWVYATPDPTLSPEEAEELLSLRPHDKGLRDSVIGIELQCFVSTTGELVTPPEPVGPHYGHNGGGIQIKLRGHVPRKCLFQTK